MALVIEDKELHQLPITIDPDIVSGTPVFAGTRVPVDALINNLEAGLTIDQFLQNFPTVTREQAIQVLDFWKTTLLKLTKSA
jgi:uncharacterized protein (DUF433 family)